MTAATTAQIGLGIDAGGTALRWCLVDAGGQLLGRGELGPVSGLVFAAEAQANARARLDELARAVVAVAKPTAVMAGITGLFGGSREAEFYTQELAQRFDLHATAVAVETDMAIAYRAACRPGTGILVYSGTGSIGFHMAADGTAVRAGGLGVIIDDAGSGFWIAKEAVKALFRAEDAEPGSGWATPLGRHLAAGFGAATWDAARTYIFSGERGRVGLLARNVATAANDGDATACAIFEAAGRELARLGCVLLNRLGPREVVLAGGASGLHPLLWQSFAADLPPGTPHRHATLDAARAAAIAALELTA